MRTEEQISTDAANRRAFSNGTEFDIWADRWCYDCVHDNWKTEKYCPILSVALLGQWPTEWTRGKVEFTTVEGNPAAYDVVDTCTEFEQRRDDDPGDEPPAGPGPFEPEMPGQVDMFEVFVEQGIDQLTSAPELAGSGQHG